MREIVVFRPMSVIPEPPAWLRFERPALLLNRCDGYHQVFARWWIEEGEFRGFFDFLGTCRYDEGEHGFVAWALLPDEIPLIEHFTGDA